MSREMPGASAFHQPREKTPPNETRQAEPAPHDLNHRPGVAMLDDPSLGVLEYGIAQ